ncbi:uncharacterized protein LOC112504629 [Cynara cardunculus var. scolymus]|uniref:uncharacterized protein LOC112504629 n=1 Tax=Cynara cardunculus var. scolymus TaxID=59895 RepID=UPI000D62B72B|nr:uncharacterized protein LOC112504629 [Cynara cardunculus var. scolymus]
MVVNNITFLEDLDIQKDDFTVKVRIVRLWKQPVFKNSDEIYSIEMILMDEQGTKIQANFLKKWVPKFRNLLQEGAAVFIKNPIIARHATKYKLIDNTNKLNVNGEIIACETMVTLSDNNGKAKRRMQVEMQDLEGIKMQVTLWDAFAQELNDYGSTNKDKGIVILVIQFAMVKIYRERPFLSNSFNVTRLLINSDIDEINDFKKSLIRESGKSKSSQQISLLSGLSYSYREFFLDRTSRANIVEISETVEAKSLIVLGTVKAFRKDVPWFYMGCTRCNRKVRTMYTITDKDDGSGMKEESESFDCTTDRCRGKKTEDDTGIVSLTLFDREANKVLNQTATEFYKKVKELAELESVNLLSTDFSSQDKLKDVVSFTGENATIRALQTVRNQKRSCLTEGLGKELIGSGFLKVGLMPIRKEKDRL